MTRKILIAIIVLLVALSVIIGCYIVFLPFICYNKSNKLFT